MFYPKIDIYHRYPDQLVTSLAKVGGLLGLLKLISFFLVIYHQRLFERDYYGCSDCTTEEIRSLKEDNDHLKENCKLLKEDNIHQKDEN